MFLKSSVFNRAAKRAFIMHLTAYGYMWSQPRVTMTVLAKQMVYIDAITTVDTYADYRKKSVYIEGIDFTIGHDNVCQKLLERLHTLYVYKQFKV